jgi:hypothetical protein
MNHGSREQDDTEIGITSHRTPCSIDCRKDALTNGEILSRNRN